MRPWALITGASRGLGFELAQKFWENGYQLLLVSRSLEPLEVIREKLHPTRQQACQIFDCDLGSSEELSRFLAKIERLSPIIRVLINNAAIQGPIGEFVENDPQQWEYLAQGARLRQFIEWVLPLIQASHRLSDYEALWLVEPLPLPGYLSSAIALPGLIVLTKGKGKGCTIDHTSYHTTLKKEI